MTHKVIGKAIDTESWLRLDEPEYCQRPMIDDIVLMSDVCGETVYRVGGGDGYRPQHLYCINQDAVNDEPADLAEYRELQHTYDSLARENA